MVHILFVSNERMDSIVSILLSLFRFYFSTQVVSIFWNISHPFLRFTLDANILISTRFLEIKQPFCVSLFRFFLEIHAARPHRGQINVAAILRALLHSDVFPSEIAGQFFKYFFPFIHLLISSKSN